MLNGIPIILSPNLVKLMMEMGHGDEIVIGDGNFPAAGVANRLVRMDGHCMPEVLDAILPLFPLDAYVKSPVTLMSVIPGDTIVPTIWETYNSILKKHNYNQPVEEIERYVFYERARSAFTVVATSEPQQYANIILKKGIVK